MTFNVTLNTVDLDAETRRARAIRARELLEGASWVFDEFIAECARAWLANDDPIDGYTVRDRLHRRVQVATEMKAHLISIVDRQLAEEKTLERRTRHESPADHA